ncbi:methionyl-tRNA formyltransferase [Stecheria intestinalis]|jgi:methionyl-tRNA formyltransferase|uniref:methionyl-tRNA formyltransferase n=1 Tax=Stecheria intestinalis TaxID=2606630 RepID=UPI0023F55BC5|nr:methionyl-tRNA formyltransferase [Stecheria intestinalis]MDD5880760.1 methionyl-tRNA formyltransferase [Stecheria intestinalis]
MDSIRIVFFGTAEFAAAILNRLYEDGHQVVGVVSQPDRPIGRKHLIEPTPVHALAEAHGTSCIAPRNLKEEPEGVLAMKPDLIITCAYGQFVPDVILEAPRFGCLNIHPSALPKYRGGAPIQRTIWNGDSSIDICLMEMVHAMDAGRIFARTSVPVDPDETSGQLFRKLAPLAADLLSENLPKYLNGELAGEPQDERQKTIARNISREEEQIFFEKEQMPELYNHCRALLEEPGPYGMIDHKRIKFLEVRMEQTEEPAVPGTILDIQNHAMRIACRGGILKVFRLQMQGKNAMDADAFMNGAGRNLIGRQFE